MYGARQGIAPPENKSDRGHTPENAVLPADRFEVKGVAAAACELDD